MGSFKEIGRNASMHTISLIDHLLFCARGSYKQDAHLWYFVLILVKCGNANYNSH